MTEKIIRAKNIYFGETDYSPDILVPEKSVEEKILEFESKADWPMVVLSGAFSNLGIKDTLDEWIDHFKFHDMNMASAFDIYYAMKRSYNRKMLGDKNAEEDAEYFRKKIKDDQIITSTRVIYYKKANAENVINHFAADEKVKRLFVRMSHFVGLTLDELMDDRYQTLQKLFSTKDDPKTIAEVLKFYSKKNTKDIIVSIGSTKDESCPLTLSFFENKFYIDGINDIETKGLAFEAKYLKQEGKDNV